LPEFPAPKPGARLQRIADNAASQRRGYRETDRSMTPL
jgi:hypothetical protein